MVYQLVSLGTTKPYIRHFLNYLASLAANSQPYRLQPLPY